VYENYPELLPFKYFEFECLLIKLYKYECCTITGKTWNFGKYKTLKCFKPSRPTWHDITNTRVQK
jgi:hypothetical protein